MLPRDSARAAYQIGLLRSMAGRGRAGTHRFRWAPTPEEQRHVDGMSAVAEALVACVLGRRWLSTGTAPDAKDAGDIEGGISVRWTELPYGSLIVHEDEPHTLVPVLVTGKLWPNLTVVGWCPMAEAQQQKYWRKNVRHPAFFVPYRDVARRPIETIR